MRLWHLVHSRLRSLFFRTRRESDLSDELQLHLERETERLQASGLAPEDARLRAMEGRAVTRASNWRVSSRRLSDWRAVEELRQG
jgi:hypothetical protein